MKKRTLFGCIILFAAMVFTSCDGFNLGPGTEDELGQLAGHSSLTITRNTSEGSVTDSLRFGSSIVDIFTFETVDTNLPTGYSTIDISANVNLTESNVSLAFPFMYFRLNDTTTGTYQFDTILTLDMLANLNFDTLINILANPDGGNMILIAENDSCWYITYGGDFVVTEFPSVGGIVRANFTNVNAWYVTQSKVNELAQDIDNMNYSHLADVDYYFPRVTFTGSVESRRWAVIHRIFEEAFVNGGISSK